MSDEITKAEIQAMIEVQAKSAEQLATIAGALKDIVDREEKISNRLFNGLSKDISANVTEKVLAGQVTIVKELDTVKKVGYKIDSGVIFLKWIYGGLFALVALAWLILQTIDHVTKGHGIG